MLPQYLVAHLLELLAKDPRTNLLDARVRVVGNRVFITGSVEAPRLRASAEEVMREVVPPGMEIVNELCVVTYAP